jgi:hypothetical protein
MIKRNIILDSIRIKHAKESITLLLSWSKNERRERMNKVRLKVQSNKKKM